MKKISLVIALLFTILASAQSKIGTIDADYVLTRMPEIAEVNKGLESYNTQLQSEMETNIKEYEELIKDYQENNMNFSEEEKKDKEAAIINLENDIKGFRQKASVLLQMKRNELSKPLYDKIDGAMLEVIKEEGYTHIFHAGGNGLAYATPNEDITETVMEKLNIPLEEKE